MSGRSIDSIIFDLDGTLIDSLPGIGASVAVALRECMPGYDLPQLHGLVGPPIGLMFQRLYPERTVEQIGAMVAAFRRHYDTVGCVQSRLYDGVARTLETLHARGLQLFVLTNKPAGPTAAILKTLGILDRFRFVVSPDSPQAAFSVKSAGAVWLQERYALAAERTLLVGDGVDDAHAAERCGFKFLLAAYGYGQAARAGGLQVAGILDSFFEIDRFVV